MLLHSYHNLDTKILLEASDEVNWYDVNAVFDIDNVTEIDYYPDTIGRWKYKNRYYELNKKNNWMRWDYAGEKFSYTWSKKINVGDEMNDAEKTISEQVKKFMDVLNVSDYGFRFLKLKPTDKMIWHIDSPNHAPSAFNISLKDKSPIVFENEEIVYNSALIDVSKYWHTVKAGKEERLTFKIVPKINYQEMQHRLSVNGFLPSN